MSKFLLLSKFNHKEKIQKSDSSKKKIKLPNKLAKPLIIGLVIVMGISYLVLTNNVSTLGFELRSLEDRVEQLQVDNEKMEIEAAQVKSLQNIEEKSKELNLVSASGGVKYLEKTGSEVAAK